MCVYLHWGLFNVSYGVRPVSCKSLGQTKYLIKFCSFVKCRNISIKSQKYGTGISVFSFSSKFTSQVTDKKIAQLAFCWCVRTEQNRTKFNSLNPHMEI